MAISPKLRVRINLVAFVVLGLGLSYAMANHVLSVLQERYSVYAIFPDTGGVFTNQEVTYRGVNVGQVGDMEVVPEGVSIELLIEEEVQIPKENVEARVMFKSAVGEQFVDLLPGSDSGPYLDGGDTIPLDQTSIPVSTQELLTTLQAVLEGIPPDSLEGAITSLGEGLGGRGKDLATIIESTADLADLFAARAPQIEGILREGTEVGGAFIDSKEDFTLAIEELVTASEVLETSTDDLRRLLIGGNAFSDEVVALLRDNRAELNEFLVDFAEVNELQALHADELDAILTNLPKFLDAVIRSFEPETGLIRFGLVQDQDNHPCSYGTDRRDPELRGFKLPPKYADCKVNRNAGEGPIGEEGVGEGAGPLTDGEVDALISEVDRMLEVEEQKEAAEHTPLPSHMSDLSWVLLYENAL